MNENAAAAARHPHFTILSLKITFIIVMLYISSLEVVLFNI